MTILRRNLAQECEIPVIVAIYFMYIFYESETLINDTLMIQSNIKKYYKKLTLNILVLSSLEFQKIVVYI